MGFMGQGDLSAYLQQDHTDTGLSSVLPMPTTIAPTEHQTLDDSTFTQNLQALYDRRLTGARQALDALEYERSKLFARADMIKTLRK